MYYFTVYCKILSQEQKYLFELANALAYYKDVFYSNHLCCKMRYYTVYCEILRQEQKYLSALDKRSSLLQRRFLQYSSVL